MIIRKILVFPPAKTEWKCSHFVGKPFVSLPKLSVSATFPKEMVDFITSEMAHPKSRQKCQVSIESQRVNSSESVRFVHISDVKTTTQKRTMFLP